MQFLYQPIYRGSPAGCVVFLKVFAGLPLWLMIHLPKQGTGFDPWLGTNILHASRETKPTAATTETVGTRACFLQQEKAMHCNKDPAQPK